MNKYHRDLKPSAMAMVAVFICGILLGGCDLLASADKLKADTTSALSAHNFTIAAEAAEKWSKKAPGQFEPFFFLAQAQAQIGNKNAALVALEQAIKNGLKDEAQIDKNNYLDPIKTMMAYQDLMKNNFPGRAVTTETTPPKSSVTEKNGQQVLRAGDIVIQVPALQ